MPKLTQARLRTLCGWIDNPWWVEQVVATLPRPLFGLAASELVRSSTDTGDALFWWAEEKVLGRRLPAHNQQIGDCVSHGGGRAVQDLKLIEIMRGAPDEQSGKREAWQGEIATEPLYGAGRVQIGGGRLGNQDGSLGAWNAKAVNQCGVLLRKDYGSGNDFRSYSGQTAKRLGRDGLPRDLADTADDHIVRTVSMVTTAEEGRAALQNWYPIPVCSSVGFTTVRDSEGFCRPEGRWDHCMLARGYCLLKGGKPAVVIQQSWGESPTGPNRFTLESGKEDTLPQGCFFITLDVFGSILKQRDSFAFSSFAGFPSQQFDFSFWK